MLLILYGFPGSGKSTFARGFTELVSSVHLQTDKVSAEVFDNQESPEYDKLLKYMTATFLQSGLSVIYDGSTATAGERRALNELAKANKITSLIVWLQIDPDTAYFRTQNRDRRKNEDKFARSYTEDSFADALAYQQNPDREQYVVISGKHTFNTQSAAVLKKLDELGIVSSFQAGQANVVKPGLVNLVPQKIGGRVDMSRRNISIR